MKISKRALNLKSSPTLTLAAKAKELTSEGKDVISLTVGEPDWAPFDEIKLSAIEAIQNNQGRYTPVNGLPQLRRSIIELALKDTGIKYEPNQVTVSTGGKFIIYSAIQAIIDEGDEVIIPAPYWVSYPAITELAGGKSLICVCDASSNYKLTAENLRQVITEKSQLLILNSPSNPTGYLYSEEELKQLIGVLDEYPQLRILSDDIYNRLVFEGEVAPHILKVAPHLKDRVLVMNGVAKSFAMTGWRVGWALGDQEWINAMNKIQSQSVSSACEISQRATITAIDNCLEKIYESVSVLKERVNFFVDGLNEVGLTTKMPDGAFYVWPSIKSFMGKTYKGQKINGSDDFAQFLLDDYCVATVPGVAFGLDGYIRMSYALEPSRLRDAIDRLREFTSKIQF